MDPRPLHKTMGVMAIIFGAISAVGWISNISNLEPLAIAIVFVLIGFEIIRYSQKGSHYNISSKYTEP